MYSSELRFEIIGHKCAVLKELSNRERIPLAEGFCNYLFCCKHAARTMAMDFPY